MQNFRGCVAELLLKMLHEAAVFFDQGEPDVVSGQILSQRSQAGPDFDNMIARLDLQAPDNPLGEILVMQKILTKAAGRDGFAFSQVLLDLA